MKHLFQNDEGELVAADTIEQAQRYHDCELGGYPEPLPGWEEVDDGAIVPIGDGESVIRKTAREWAGECDAPSIVATTYA